MVDGSGRISKGTRQHLHRIDPHDDRSTPPLTRQTDFASAPDYHRDCSDTPNYPPTRQPPQRKGVEKTEGDVMYSLFRKVFSTTTKTTTKTTLFDREQQQRPNPRQHSFVETTTKQTRLGAPSALMTTDGYNTKGFLRLTQPTK